MDSMLLAKVPSLAVQRLPGKLPAKRHTRWGSDPRHERRLVFDGIADWPHLSRIFRQVAADLIAREGAASWLSQGGARAADGSPSFGIQSPAASAILHRIAGQVGAFHYIDEQGDHWAVLLATEDRGRCVAWQGLALGGALSPCLLSQPVRENALCAIAQQLDGLNQPAVLGADSVDPDRLRLSQWRRRLRLLDVGLRLLPRLAHSAARDPKLQAAIPPAALARATWGPADDLWPAEWESLVFDAIASLCSVHVQVVDLPKTGWSPRTISRGPAITCITQQNPALIRVHLAHPFLTFLSHWLGRRTEAAQFATSVRNASIANLACQPLQDVTCEYK
jgi:hypothetical protein